MEFRNNTNPYQQLPLPKNWWRKPLYIIAFGFGSVAAPFAPGTFGTLATIPLLLIANYFFSANGFLIFTIVFSLFAIWITNKISREINIHDHPGMCIDEFVGFFFTMLYLPTTLFNIVVGFALFRFFDIVKPWPIRYLDKNIHGGVGMILDDIVAGLFSCAILHLINYYF